MKKIFLDTDIGTDPDDGLCLTYLLKQTACDLLGITTVGREATIRAKLAEVFTRHFGRTEIPIAAGADIPYFPTPYWWDHKIGQAPVLDEWPVETDYARGAALELMRRAIRANPGEVTLVAVGPLTNVGLLAAADPETASMVKELVLMGGFLPEEDGTGRCECNTMLDPVSAGAVYHRPWPELRVVSVDTTRATNITGEQIYDRLDRDDLAPLFGFAEVRQGRGNAKGIGGHDPLTAASIFAPELLPFQRGRVGITLSKCPPKKDESLEGDNITGWTTFTPEEGGPHGWARPGDWEAMKAAFHEHLFEVLSG
jgi:purine nucleosidase